jgi:hypothetical protein
VREVKKRKNQRYESGLELVLLARMPGFTLAATVIPLLVSLFARLPMLLDSPDNNIGSLKTVMSVDIFSIALLITLWTALFTLAIGCIIVWVMKGPEYTADSYDLQDSEYPKKKKTKDD